MSPGSRPDEHRDRTAWSIADWAIVTGLTMVAGLVRFIGLTDPSSTIYDERYYTGIACRIQGLDAGACAPTNIGYIPHPPLGELLIAAGGRVFGNGAFGWRFFPALAGTLTITLIYVVGRKLFRYRISAALASFLLAIDFLHLVNSRAAVLDVFVPFFATAGLLCILLDRERSEREPPWFRRPWLILAGICAGASIASKWSGFFALGGLLAVFLWWAVSDSRKTGADRPLDHAVRTQWPSILACFFLIPVLCVCLSYIGRIHGSILSPPWADGSWLGAWWSEQWTMYKYHSGYGLLADFRSPAWSWPLLKRPQPYFYEATSDGDIRWIMAGGSPLVWWTGTLAVFYCAFRWVKEGLNRPAFGTIVIGFLISYALYIPLSVQRSVWISYFLPAVVFLCLAIGAVFDDLVGSGWGRAAAVAFAVSASGLFVFFYPVLTAKPLSPEQRALRIWFKDCDAAGWHVEFDPSGPIGLQKRLLPSGAPPDGWCWGEAHYI